MKDETLIKAEREYILTCPYIKDIFKVNINFLDSEVDNFSVIQIPCQPLLKTYVLGNKLCQSMFALVGRLNYSENTEENIENMGLFEKFEEWIEKNNNNRIFPKLKEGLIPKEVNIISNGYITETAENLEDAVYQIELQLIYEKEGNYGI